MGLVERGSKAVGNETTPRLGAERGPLDASYRFGLTQDAVLSSPDCRVAMRLPPNAILGYPRQVT
jgi:hypothetical protein